MNVVTVIRSLGPIDARNVGRDAMLRWMVLLPFVVAAAMRWLLPTIFAFVDGLIPLDLASVYAPLMGYLFLLLVPYFWGVVVGFLLLDQRDDGTLTALQVTPLSLNSYLLYRLATPVLLSAVTTMSAFPLTGLAQFRLWPLALLALSAALHAPLFALALAALAQNKVQGLALMKASGVVLLPPLAALFLPDALQWPLAFLPTYWPARFYWALADGDPAAGLYWLVSLIFQALLLVLLARRFDRIMHR
ncbi:MAG: hypothetical protein R3248_11405 [Candidatus Promineifilaceae bacterium]|nr:hypothetical protein [Candidatus Promineifilaceae bacterium]